jgi:hypothetical protein
MRAHGRSLTSPPAGAAQPPGNQLPAALKQAGIRVYELRQQPPPLTRGEGVLESTFGGYQPVSGAIPARPRSDHNPLNREQYLLHVVRRVANRGRSR